MATHEHTGEFDASPAYIKGIVLEFCNCFGGVQWYSLISQVHHETWYAWFWCQSNSYWNQVNFLMTPFSTLSYWNKVLIKIAWHALQTCVHYSNFSYLLLSGLCTSHLFLKALSRSLQKQGKTSRNLVQLRFLEYSSILHPSPVALTLGGFDRQLSLDICSRPCIPFQRTKNPELLINLNWYFSVMPNFQN